MLWALFGVSHCKLLRAICIPLRAVVSGVPSSRLCFRTAFTLSCLLFVEVCLLLLSTMIWGCCNGTWILGCFAVSSFGAFVCLCSTSLTMHLVAGLLCILSTLDFFYLLLLFCLLVYAIGAEHMYVLDQVQSPAIKYCPRMRCGSHKTALEMLYNRVCEWQCRLAVVKRPPLLSSWWSLLSIAMLL